MKASLVVVVSYLILGTAWAQPEKKTDIPEPEFQGEGQATIAPTQTKSEAQKEAELGDEERAQAVRSAVVYADPKFNDHSFVPLSMIRIGGEENGSPGVLGEADSMIVNGVNAKRKTIPYVVSIQLFDLDTGYWYHLCGGALIASNKVLTAAHCVYYYWYYFYFYNEKIRVGLGWYNLNYDEHNPHSLTLYVSDIKIHERYDPELYGNDIAILTLSECAKFTEHIQPIAPAPKDIKLNYYYYCTLSGWGITEDGGFPHLLQTTETHILSEESCKHFWNPYAKIKKNMICELGWPKLISACTGDSGGPLVCRGYLVGLASWGHTLCLGCLPGVHARVSHFQGWIKKNC